MSRLIEVIVRYDDGEQVRWLRRPDDPFFWELTLNGDITCADGDSDSRQLLWTLAAELGKDAKP